jgi:hypothetical protein
MSEGKFNLFFAVPLPKAKFEFQVANKSCLG